MATVTMDATDLVNSLGNVVKNLTKELSIVSNKTAKRSKSLIAKDIARELAVPQKVIKSKLKSSKVGKTGAAVELSKSARIPLRDFKARQTKRGVSYRISKSEGRKTVAGAFTGPRPGLTFTRFRGRVFKRVGKSRLPIKQLFGPSPWGVFVIGKRTNHVRPQINLELKKQLRERIRYKTLKKSGAI